MVLAPFVVQNVANDINLIVHMSSPFLFAACPKTMHQVVAKIVRL